MKHAATLAMLAGLWCAAPDAFQSPVPALSGLELAQRIRAAVRLDNQLQFDFTYVERRRDVRISRLGKVTLGPIRTFEVVHSSAPGQTYKRLIAVDGKPLTAEELASREAEHERDIQEAKARAAREAPAERAERLKDATAEQRQREAILEDAFKVFEAKIERRETI